MNPAVRLLLLGGVARGPELKSSGAAAIVGVATAATYDTATGAGAVTRVDVSNQSFVLFSGLLAGATYRMSITNTGADILGVRRGTQGGAVITTLAAGLSTVISIDMLTLTQISITYGSAAGTAAFTVNSLVQLR